MHIHSAKTDAADEHGDCPQASERSDDLIWRAAAEGRTDVLGRQDLARLHRSVGNRAVQRMATANRSPVLDVITGGGGQPLDGAVRADMEQRLGADFGDVRVHTDARAAASAEAVQAHAYTVGTNIVFDQGRYDTASTAGRTLLAHELTHVIQQRSGPVSGTPTGDGVSVSDPSDSYEVAAARNAERAMAQPDATNQP